jgi:hypothetical protein
METMINSWLEGFKKFVDKQYVIDLHKFFSHIWIPVKLSVQGGGGGNDRDDDG